MIIEPSNVSRFHLGYWIYSYYPKNILKEHFIYFYLKNSFNLMLIKIIIISKYYNYHFYIHNNYNYSCINTKQNFLLININFISQRNMYIEILIVIDVINKNKLCDMCVFNSQFFSSSSLSYYPLCI